MTRHSLVRYVLPVMVGAALLVALFIALAGGNEPGTRSGELTASLCDINTDGVCDEADMTLFDEAFGTKRGEQGYHPLADADADGLVTSQDREILFP